MLKHPVLILVFCGVYNDCEFMQLLHTKAGKALSLDHLLKLVHAFDDEDVGAHLVHTERVQLRDDLINF